MIGIFTFLSKNSPCGQKERINKKSVRVHRKQLRVSVIIGDKLVNGEVMDRTLFCD